MCSELWDLGLVCGILLRVHVITVCNSRTKKRTAQEVLLCSAGDRNPNEQRHVNVC